MELGGGGGWHGRMRTMWLARTGINMVAVVVRILQERLVE